MILKFGESRVIGLWIPNVKIKCQIKPLAIFTVVKETDNGLYL
jgi:hypothetical protein